MNIPLNIKAVFIWNLWAAAIQRSISKQSHFHIKVYGPAPAINISKVYLKTCEIWVHGMTMYQCWCNCCENDTKIQRKINGKEMIVKISANWLTAQDNGNQWNVWWLLTVFHSRRTWTSTVFLLLQLYFFNLRSKYLNIFF